MIQLSRVTFAQTFEKNKKLKWDNEINEYVRTGLFRAITIFLTYQDYFYLIIHTSKYID